MWAAVAGWLAQKLAGALGWLLTIVSAPAVAQATQTGGADAAAAQALAAEKAAEAEAQAAVDAPKTVAGVEKDLEDGSF